MGRILGATANIFFSLVFGAAALAFVAVQWPGAMELLLDWGSWLTNELGSTGLDPKYNVWVKFLMNEQQIVFMGFVILMRIILAMIMGGFSALFGMNRSY